MEDKKIICSVEVFYVNGALCVASNGPEKLGPFIEEFAFKVVNFISEDIKNESNS